MVSAELIKYIQKELKKNTPIDAIQGVLNRHGWKEEEINEGLRLALQDKKLLSETLHLEKDSNLSSTLSSWGLFKSALYEYKQRFRVYSSIVGITLLFTVPLQIVRYFIGMNITTIQTSLSKNTYLLLFVILWSLFVFCILILIQTWSTAALLVAIRDRNKAIGFREAFNIGSRYIWPLLVIGILTLCWMMLGFVAFIIPMVLFGVWYGFSSFILVNEGLRGAQALARSKNIVKGRWWFVYWKFVYITFITILMSLVISIPIGFVPLPMFKELGQIVINVITTPISVIYMFFVYENLRNQS